MHANLDIIYKDKTVSTDMFVCYDLSPACESTIWGRLTPKNYIISMLRVQLRSRYRSLNMVGDIFLLKKEWDNEDDEYNINGILTFALINGFDEEIEQVVVVVSQYKYPQG